MGQYECPQHLIFFFYLFYFTFFIYFLFIYLFVCVCVCVCVCVIPKPLQSCFKMANNGRQSRQVEVLDSSFLLTGKVLKT